MPTAPEPAETKIVWPWRNEGIALVSRALEEGRGLRAYRLQVYESLQAKVCSLTRHAEDANIVGPRYAGFVAHEFNTGAGRGNVIRSPG